MKLNEKALKQSMENAKKNFNKACDKVMEAFKKMNKAMINSQQELMHKFDDEERPCCGGHCHCHDHDGDHICQCKENCNEAIEPEFELENKDEE